MAWQDKTYLDIEYEKQQAEYEAACKRVHEMLDIVESLSEKLKNDDVTKALLGDRYAQKIITDRGQLLPCPFCGEQEKLSIKPVRTLWTYHLFFEEICRVECGNCGCEGTVCAGIEIARKSWNSRERIIKNLGE